MHKLSEHDIAKKYNLNNELPIDQMCDNYAIESYSFMPSNITPNSIEFIIPRICDAIIDCFLIFPKTRPIGNICISIIRNNKTIDQFRIDHSEIYIKLRDSKLLSSNIIPIKTFFNKYSQNYLPMNNNIKIIVNNDHMISDEIKLIVQGVYISGIYREIFLQTAIRKQIEQYGSQNSYLNTDWINYRETCNILLKSKHNFFNITCLLKYILSYIKPNLPSCIVQEDISIKLKCEGPVTELYWFAKCNNKIANIIKKSQLLFNGIIRDKHTEPAFYQQLKQYAHYNNLVDNVNVYPFCIHPTHFQIYNYTDMSTLDEIKLVLGLEYSRIEKYEIIVCWTNLNIITYNLDGSHTLEFCNDQYD